MSEAVPLEGITEDQLRELEKSLLDRVPVDGTAVGNTKLKKQLAWDDTKYWFVRGRLLDRGVLEVGRGRGGSIRLPVAPVAATIAVQFPPVPVLTVAAEAPLIEENLYQAIATVLRDQWVKDRRYDQAVVEITARQGARVTGGRWTRPDIVVGSLAMYPYVPGRHFDITTFEVKTYAAMDVTAVYEALAHLRAATQAVVLLVVPDAIADTYEETINTIQDEAERHGVGLVVAASADDYEEWDSRVEPKRHEPSPEKLNDFIATQTSAHFKETIVKWFR